MLQIGTGQRRQPEPFLQCTLRNLVVPEASWQSHRQVQTGLFSFHIDRHTQIVLEALKQRTPTISIQQTHSADVSREMSFPHEVRHHALKKSRRTDVDSDSDGEKAVDKIQGNYDV